MPADVKLVWISARDAHTRKVDENAARAYDEKAPVGVVRRAAGDPMNRGAWRWSMSACTVTVTMHVERVYPTPEPLLYSSACPVRIRVEV
jgi:hypothetical protein